MEQCAVEARKWGKQSFTCTISAQSQDCCMAGRAQVQNTTLTNDAHTLHTLVCIPWFATTVSTPLLYRVQPTHSYTQRAAVRGAGGPQVLCMSQPVLLNVLHLRPNCPNATPCLTYDTQKPNK
jgi:hypothetical protein